ncbi:MAG: hypothetical protein ACHP84_20935 [Caulobacterales bacterium]
MKLEIPDAAQNAATFWAVFLGAFLAAAAGLAASQVEAFFQRRERERAAALLFGEIFSTLQVLLKLSDEVRAVGDPYGPITMRMLRAARRELDVYDRNRETLYDLRDAPLRVRIHNLVLRITMPLDGLIDSSADVAAARAMAEDVDLKPAQREEAARALAQLQERRDQGFEFTMSMEAAIGPLVEGLGRIARHDFVASADAARASAPTAPRRSAVKG